MPKGGLKAHEFVKPSMTTFSHCADPRNCHTRMHTPHSSLTVPAQIRFDVVLSVADAMHFSSS